MEKTENRLACLQASVFSLNDQFSGLNEQLLGETKQLLASVSSGGIDDKTSTSSGTVAELVDSIAMNNACQHYLQYLLELQMLLKSADKVVRLAQRSIKTESGLVHTEHISNAVEAVSKCGSYVHAMNELSQKVGPELSAIGRGAVKNSKDIAHQVRRVISGCIQKYLEVCKWPPPLLPSQQDDGTQMSFGPWNGFEQAGDSVFADLQQMLVLMTSLQIVVEGEVFANITSQSAQNINLWSASEFAQPVNDWIQRHFAPDMPTCKVEKPEWLFSAVYHAAKACSEYLDIFDPCVAAHGLQQYFSMGIEFSKSIYLVGLHKAVKGVYLPLLFDQNDAAYILHFMDESMKFEGRYLPLRRDTILEDADSVEISHPKSIVEIVFENPQWSSDWLGFEQEEARQRIFGLTHSAQAWKPQPTFTNDGNDLASSHEFYPAEIIIAATEILVDLFGKVACIYTHEHKMLWCSTVVQTALETLELHFESEIRRSEQFEHLLDDIGLPVIAGCLNGLHFLEHTMMEPSGVLLQVLTNSPTIVVFLDSQANRISKLRRKWTNKLISLAMKYIFSSFFQTQILEESLDDDSSNSMPSARAMELRFQISSLLNEMSKHLDEVLFREVWRGIAFSTNDSFLEDLEHTDGIDKDALVRLHANLSVLVSAFSSLTSKPESYFKSSMERLRQLDR